ncbi:MAG: transposase family protein [Desulfobacterales bacterium]|nr:transposase family protein [Desulfobacterales bacterium]
MKALTEKIRSIGLRIFTVLRKSDKLTYSQLAEEADTSKSSAFRQVNGIERRNVYPESVLWEHEEGYEWIRRHFFATLLIFGVQHGIGADALSRYFKMIRLDTHIGVSPTALRTRLSQLQDLIILFQKEAEQNYKDTFKEVIGAADETFFGNALILVFMDLSSGYLILEDIADDRSFDTWFELLKPRLEELGIHVPIMVSDRAKALIKLALVGLECEHNADIFHGMHEISKWMGSTLGRRKGTAKRQLNKCELSLEKAEKRGASKKVVASKVQQVEQARAQDQAASQNLDNYRGTVRKISKTVHPFNLNDNKPQDSANVAKKLREQAEAIETLACKHGINDNTGVMKKFKNQIKELVPSIDFWWLYVLTNLIMQGNRCNKLMNWAKFSLLPTVYWYEQMKNTKNPTLRKEYKKAWENALFAFHTHALTGTFSGDELLFWQNWAQEMVGKFYRASSAVEGRNGFLSQIYHNKRGLSSKSLKALTVMHNYFTIRSDGSTAAQRLFGEKPPDLFEWLLHRMGELPLPRKARKRVVSNPLNLRSVPA